ncbi:hypothetical protein NKJ72_16105 [Mesorhizobium sp. M0045]|uniref:hypothetical protein n=1 Tax=Mesorhizobium sp. M0045 TaxID=2956857 RepID=UPI0033353F29
MMQPSLQASTLAPAVHFAREASRHYSSAKLQAGLDDVGRWPSDRAGLTFVRGLELCFPGGAVGKKQRIVLLAAVLASAFGVLLLILILQMVSFLVD